MVASPLARPDSIPEEVAPMVRVSDDVQAKSAVTSLVEPSLKVATAFSWVVLPMATAGCDGIIDTDCNSTAPAPFAAGAAAAAITSDALVAPTGELTLLTGPLTAAAET